MFKLFSSTEKPASTNSRPKGQPATHSFSAIIDSPSSSTITVDGQKLSFIQPPSSQPTATGPYESLFSAPLTEPTKAHQPNLTEQVRSNRELPPLITTATESGKNHNSQPPQLPSLSTQQQHGQLHRHSALPSLQSSTTKASHTSTFVADGEKQCKATEKPGKLAGWFRGESEPITVGLVPSPTKETADPFESTASVSETQPTAPRKRKSTISILSKPAMASRFSFFANKASSAKSVPQPLSLNDELIEIDVSKALHPAAPQDPGSPAAFKTLQQQAENLLLRLQTAYKERTIALQDMAAEKEALAEETEGAETKVRHLKTQLDAMSVKLASQDEAMMNLVDELAQEKLARQEEEEARKRSVRLVEHATPTNSSRRRRTLSNPTSDSGFESEDDSSSGESVFSRRNGTNSPAFSMSSVSTINSPDAIHEPGHQSSMAMAQSARLRKLPTGQANRKGASQPPPSAALHQHDIIKKPATSQRMCANCNSMQAAEAWGVVDVLKEENQCMKQRVGELENALEGCLELVGGLG